MTHRDAPKRMALERFEALVEAYGAEPEAWPENERDAASALLASSDEAQRALEQAAALDAMLDQAPSIEASPALTRNVLEAAPQRRRTLLGRLDGWTERLWPFTPRWQPALALVAAAVLGVIVGVGLPNASEASEPVDVAELAFGSEVEWVAAEESEMP